jgi:hypothetical protein
MRAFEIFYAAGNCRLAALDLDELGFYNHELSAKLAKRIEGNGTWDKQGSANLVRTRRRTVK